MEQGLILIYIRNIFTEYQFVTVLHIQEQAPATYRIQSFVFSYLINDTERFMNISRAAPFSIPF